MKYYQKVNKRNNKSENYQENTRIWEIKTLKKREIFDIGEKDSEISQFTGFWEIIKEK